MTDQNFAVLRQQNGMSVEEAADFVGVSAKTVRRWENGSIPPRRAYLELLKGRLEQSRLALPASPDFTFADLFAGIGGMRLGFEAVGGKCVFTSEWDEYAQRTYRANFHDEHDIAGDITKIDAVSIPDHDVLLAGFPCQPFSVAGVSKKNALGHRHGFLDKAQGTLFFDVLRILKAKRPAAFLLENVKNLRGHDRGETFRVIRGALEHDLGYRISVRVIDASGYVPQHRERIFIAGFRENTGFDFDKLSFADPLRGPVLAEILHSPNEIPEAPYTEGKRVADGFRTVVSSKYTLTDHLWGYLKDYAEKHRSMGNGFGFGLNRPGDRARTLSARYYKDGSEILIWQKGKSPRRLTPRECARLMGFDPDRNTRMTIPVSDTRAYKQFGNSVAVPVVRDIARCMKPHIMRIIDPGELFSHAPSENRETQPARQARVA